MTRARVAAGLREEGRAGPQTVTRCYKSLSKTRPRVNSQTAIGRNTLAACLKPYKHEWAAKARMDFDLQCKVEAKALAENTKLASSTPTNSMRKPKPEQ